MNVLWLYKSYNLSPSSSHQASSLMELSNVLLPFLCLLLFSSAVRGSFHSRHRQGNDHGFRPTKLFVFGDSYVDTGNLRKALGSSWREPYGTTFPGKPAGRFSDGRILTDYVARSLRLKSPIAYEWRKLGGKRLLRGINFAYGGSGVFDTLGTILPNMTTQIDFLENLINGSVFTKWDLQSSAVLICLAGNDYALYVQTDSSAQGLLKFIPRVVDQLSLNLKRIRDMGAKRIVVTTLPPLGCLPRVTQPSSFRQCNDTRNDAAGFHNLLLRQSVDRLNNETSGSSIFVLDLYNSFTATLNQKGSLHGNSENFTSPLTPCCTGTCDSCSCGTVDEKGMKLYSVCTSPESAFFWDMSHPTQSGWSAAYATLKSSLEQYLQL